MRRIWKRGCTAIVSCVLVVAAMATWIGQASAAQPKPLVVASLASTDEVLANILYLTESAGVGDFGRLAALMASPYTAALDKSRPTGVFAVLEDETDVRVVSFVPVKDLKTLLLTLEAQIGKPEDLGGGVLRLGGDRPQPVYLKEADGWTFAAGRREHLIDLPKDPLALLDGLDKNYTLAVRVNVSEIPDSLKEMAVGELRQGFEDRVAQELNPQQAKATRQVGEMLVQPIVQLIQETDDITVGWQVDKAGKKTHLEVSYRALEGTELAKQAASVRNARSSFAGFLLADAAVALHGQGQSDDEERAQLTELLGQARERAMEGIERDRKLANDDERQTAKSIVEQLLDVADATVKANKLELGATLMLEPGSLAVVAGGLVADGEKLGDALKKLAAFAARKNPGKMPRIQFDAETHAGVSFHTVQIPLHGADEHVRQILGDPMDCVIGIGKQSAHVAFGKNPSALLKRVLDASAANSDKEMPPSQVRVSLSRILAFVAAATSDPQVQAALEAVRDGAGADGISVTTLPIERGAAMRLELEEGVLKAIGAAAKSRGR